MALAHLALSIAVLLPQTGDDPDPRLTSVLTKAEQKKLNTLAKKWFEAWKKWDDEEDPKKRARLTKPRDRAREKFLKEWESKEKKEPLKNVGDLLAIFDNVFPYERQSGTGELKLVNPKGGGAFDVIVPRGYDYDEKHTTIAVIPAREESGWQSSKDAYGSTWKGVAGSEDWLFVLPRLEGGVDLDVLPDLSTTSGDGVEMDRIKALLLPLGNAQKMYRFDRNRLILDAGKGSSGFAMRVGTYFPTRFAGLILRHPVEFGEVANGDGGLRDAFRVESLVGTRLLMVKSPETAEACEKIAKKLDELRPGSCTIIESGDAELQTKIAKWVSETRRNLFDPQVFLVPNHDRFRKGPWIQIDTAESVHNGPEGRPYLKAEADRNANRITVTARNVSSIQILLNDAMVDLDKEFTVVINGKALTEKRERRFHTLTEFLSFDLFDPNRVWTTTYTTSVPKAEGTGGGGPGNGAK